MSLCFYFRRFFSIRATSKKKSPKPEDTKDHHDRILDLISSSVSSRTSDELPLSSPNLDTSEYSDSASSSGAMEQLKDDTSNSRLLQVGTAYNIQLTPSYNIQLTPSYNIQLTPSYNIQLTPSYNIQLTSLYNIQLTPQHM